MAEWIAVLFILKSLKTKTLMLFNKCLDCFLAICPEVPWSAAARRVLQELTARTNESQESGNCREHMVGISSIQDRPRQGDQINRRALGGVGTSATWLLHTPLLQCGNHKDAWKESRKKLFYATFHWCHRMRNDWLCYRRIYCTVSHRTLNSWIKSMN